MANNECVPYWDTADTLTARTSVAVAGKRLVAVTGPRLEDHIQVGYLSGGAKHFGVTGYDAPAGADVTIHHARSIVAPVTAGAAIAAGEPCTSDAEGRAVPAASIAGSTVVGVALDPAAVGADVVLDRSVR